MSLLADLAIPRVSATKFSLVEPAKGSGSSELSPALGLYAPGLYAPSANAHRPPLGFSNLLNHAPATTISIFQESLVPHDHWSTNS